jgi:hypothetical protein
MTPFDPRRAAVLADAMATQTAVPTFAPGPETNGLSQSMAKGAPGIALLHIERARAGRGDWNTVHAWLSAATRSLINAGPDAGLYVGAPAVAFAVHAAADRPGRYTRALTTLHATVSSLTRDRLDRAHQRLARRELPAFTEFDLFYGLTGLGAYHLHLDPHGEAVRHVLTYLVRLTEPVRHHGEQLPGWWTDRAPTGQRSADFPGGHGSLGMAHGISGPLALLALARRRGITVDGHLEAIDRICAWLDTWRRDQDAGPWWPQWIIRDEQRRRRVNQPGPLRPSWCYGTPGIARAQQLAGIATGDTARQQLAEHALSACVSDASQLGRIVDSGLCHGWAGLFQTAWRAAADAATPLIADRLPYLVALLLRHAEPSAVGTGFLEGDAGLALALHTAADPAPPISGWDACLLIA